MIPLTDLILYWKGKQQPHPPITSLPWAKVLECTISNLELLFRVLGGEK